MCIINNIYVKYLQQPQSAEEPANNLTDLHTTNVEFSPKTWYNWSQKNNEDHSIISEDHFIIRHNQSENGNTFASIGKPKI